MSEKKNLINLSSELKQSEKKESKRNSNRTQKASVPSDSKSEEKKKKTSEMKAFRMISKIEPQKRKGRYNVYINEEFAFGVDEEVLIRFGLTKGLHVNEELQKQIENEDSFYKAYQKTLNYLSYSLRTEKQLKDYLIKKELSHFTDRIIEKLKKARLIDDLIYAESYVRSMANVNQKGPNNIIQDLKSRGVSEEHIFSALDEYPEEKQLENAIDLASKKWNKTKNSSQFESIQKVKQYIVNKGFSFEMADKAVSSIHTEKDDEEEYAALIKQADKAHKRYSRKYEGYKLTQRLRAFLFSKGFPKELINRYIDERKSK